MKLERFIRDNREAFDSEEPSDELWNKISDKLPTTNGKVIEMGKPRQIVHKDFQNSGRNRFLENINWRVAAMVLFTLGLGWMVLHFNEQYKVTEHPEIVMANPALAKQVSQYTQLVENKQLELQNLAQQNPDLYKEFEKELDELENSYQSLKADLPKNQNQETLIEAMIQNLQLQLNVLNQQLQIIDRIKNSNNHKNENNKAIII
jgi:septal ring factor EnvC (AmiA/AmiB activator)